MTQRGANQDNTAPGRDLATPAAIDDPTYWRLRQRRDCMQLIKLGNTKQSRLHILRLYRVSFGGEGGGGRGGILFFDRTHQHAF